MSRCRRERWPPTSERDRVPFALAPLLVIAAAVRLLLNNVTVYSRADETVYLLYTKTLAAGGGYRAINRMFLDDRGMWVFPNPLRWSWLGATTLFCSASGECTHRTLATLSTIAGVAVVALTFWIAWELFGTYVALLATALAATSPLQLALGRRALADEFSCAAALSSIAVLLLYLRSDTSRRRAVWLVVWIAMTALAIAAKEQFLFAYPVVLLFWWLRARRLRFHEIAAWAAPPILFAGVFCLLARDVSSFFRIARIITSVMTAPYAEQFQSGPPHRLLIDSLAVAPIVTVIAIAALVSIALRRAAFLPAVRDIAVLAAGILLVHAILPSQNLRYIVAVDPLLRILAAAYVAAELADRKWPLVIGVLISAAVELTLFHRIFIVAQVYDPVTDNLLRALKMLPR